MRRSALSRGALPLLFLVLGCYTSVRQHPEYESHMRAISSVGVMPPEVSVTYVTFAGAQTDLPEIEEAVANHLRALLVAQLQSHGLSSRPCSLNEDTYERFPELRFEASQAEDAYTNAMGRAYAKAMGEEEATRYRDSLGPQVSQLAELDGVDALLFSELEGQKESSGEQAKDFIIEMLVGSSGEVNALLHLSLVDGTSGELLWSNALALPGDFENQGLEKAVEDAFKPFNR